MPSSSRPAVFRRRGKRAAVSSRLEAAPDLVHPRSKPDWVLAEVLRLAVHLRTARAVANNFNRLHGQRATVGKTWVHARCREHGEAVGAMRRGMKFQPPRSVPVGREWGIDLTMVPTADGHIHPTFAVIDHGSRALLRLKVLTRKCAWTLLSEFCAACAVHGPPMAVRTDNEGMFTGGLWVAFFRLAGIRRQRIDPGCPWQNGRVERVFGTLKRLLRRLPIPTAAALQIRLDEFTRFYNEVRVHQGLGGRTPAEAWKGDSLQAIKARYGKGGWVHALDGLLPGYRLRC